MCQESQDCSLQFALLSQQFAIASREYSESRIQLATLQAEHAHMQKEVDKVVKMSGDFAIILTSYALAVVENISMSDLLHYCQRVRCQDFCKVF